MKTCIICKKVKEKEHFEKWQHKCISCKNLFKCSICKSIKEVNQFRKDSSRSSGLSSKCKSCANKIVKNEAYYIRRKEIDKRRRNTPLRKARQFFKDSIKRLGFKESKGTWLDLGFSKEDFINKFPAIEKGMEIDHCIPLSWFKETTPINISCSIHNLQLLSKDINIRKSNSYADFPDCKEYLEKILFYIKEEYKEKIITLQGGWVG